MTDFAFTLDPDFTLEPCPKPGCTTEGHHWHGQAGRPIPALHDVPRLCAVEPRCYTTAAKPEPIPFTLDPCPEPEPEPELVACHYRDVDVEVIAKALHVCDEEWPCSEANVEYYRDRAQRIAAALSDANSGGHWEGSDEAFYRAADNGQPRRTEWVGTTRKSRYGWVPVTPPDPDAALLAIVDADTLARLREVAEVTAR